MIAHRAGWESDEWTAALEEVDGERPRRSPPAWARDEGLLVTADHGVLDVPEHQPRSSSAIAPRWWTGVRHVAGEPRCLQLHFEPEASDAVRAATLEAWRAAEGDRAWVVTRDEAVAAGWFGAVDPAWRAAHRRRDRRRPQGRRLVRRPLDGAAAPDRWSASTARGRREETQVPAPHGFGAFAR